VDLKTPAADLKTLDTAEPRCRPGVVIRRVPQQVTSGESEVRGATIPLGADHHAVSPSLVWAAAPSSAAGNDPPRSN